MTFVSDYNSAWTGIANRALAMVSRYKEGQENKRLFNKTVRELSSLSDVQLADLGLTRDIIRRTAYQAAFGN